MDRVFSFIFIANIISLVLFPYVRRNDKITNVLRRDYVGRKRRRRDKTRIIHVYRMHNVARDGRKTIYDAFAPTRSHRARACIQTSSSKSYMDKNDFFLTWSVTSNVFSTV